MRWGNLPGEEGFQWVFEGGHLCSVISKGLPLQILSLGLGHVSHLQPVHGVSFLICKAGSKYTTGLLQRLR